MQTQSALTNPRSRRYLQSDLAQIIIKKTLFIPQTESRLACSFLRINYFAIILGLINSSTNDTAQWQYNSARPHATKDSASPNKMAAKYSVPVPWPHILESVRLPKNLVLQIIIQFGFFFSSGNYRVLGIHWLKIIGRQSVKFEEIWKILHLLQLLPDTLTDLIHYYNLKTRDVISYIYCICNGWFQFV